MALGLAILLPNTGCRMESQPPDAGAIRIVSLAPSLTEIAAAIGAGHLLAGRTSVCNYPAGALERVPVVGGFGAPSIEALLAAAPTLVISTDLEDKTLIDRLQALGIAHRHIPCERLDDIAAAIRTLGALTGRAAPADALADTLETAITRQRRDAEGNAGDVPGVYLEIWHDPPMTAGRDTYLNDLITLAGGRNIAGTLARGYFRPAPEWVVQQNPAVIICAYMSGQPPARLLNARPGWNRIDAVQHGRVVHGLDNDIILRPGPRVLEAIEVLRACIVPPDPES